MPARSTVFLWLRQRPDFRQKYTFAKRFQIQWLADKMIDIADDRANDWIEREGPDGKKVRVFNPENLRLSEQQIAALHWHISKLKPKRYCCCTKVATIAPGPNLWWIARHRQ
jgi:Bacteriophage Sf6, terminase small subunit-like